MHRERNTAIAPEALTGFNRAASWPTYSTLCRGPPRRTTCARRKESHETTSSPSPRHASAGTAHSGHITRRNALRRPRVPIRRGLLRRLLTAAAVGIRQRPAGRATHEGLGRRWLGRSTVGDADERTPDGIRRLRRRRGHVPQRLARDGRL